MPEFFDILKELSSIPSPTGSEKTFAEKIAAIAKPFADEVRFDALGNLIVRKVGIGKKLMLCAHMDTIGMLATYADDKGFIRFGPLGGLDTSALYNIPVTFVNGVEGVVSVDTKVPAKDRKTSNFYIDIGAESKEDALKKVPIGTPAYFKGEARKLGEFKVSAPYLDNRAGVILLLMLISALPETDYDLHFVFSVQEEVGLRGAKVAAFDIEPDFALAIDVTDTGDLPETDIIMDVKLGHGCAVKIMDRSVICHPKITSALQECAEKSGIPYQNEIMTDGGTDAGAIHLSGGGVISGGISIPTRYIHTPCEVCDLRDIDSAYKLLRAAIEKNIFF
ncbi:MAG: M20/M25/M40 family metallo-hydrolase [Clostridia bacterium]|nr:M20/M25/M40 family metallo-hydrolase [Clostridia bacterium]